jgi:hypothetical protein
MTIPYRARVNERWFLNLLREIERVAHDQGLRYDGFETWEGSPVGTFIAEHAEEGEPNA